MSLSRGLALGAAMLAAGCNADFPPPVKNTSDAGVKGTSAELLVACLDTQSIGDAATKKRGDVLNVTSDTQNCVLNVLESYNGRSTGVRAKPGVLTAQNLIYVGNFQDEIDRATGMPTGVSVVCTPPDQNGGDFACGMDLNGPHKMNSKIPTSMGVNFSDAVGQELGVELKYFTGEDGNERSLARAYLENDTRKPNPSFSWVGDQIDGRVENSADGAGDQQLLNTNVKRASDVATKLTAQ